MADRAANGGGVATPLAVSPEAAYGGGSGVSLGTGADWFGPGNPLRPIAPPEVKGRAWDIQPARNMAQRPRPYEPVTFATLRGLADLDLLRIIIETRKDQAVEVKWKVGAKDGETMTAEQEAAAKKIETFFEKPERGRDYATWLRDILEDLFVIDAPTIYPRPDRGGGLAELRVFDGATINLIVDDWGRPAEPPAPAYQQIFHGLAAVNYYYDDLIYIPRNPRKGSPFGFSPVEQILVIVNIAIRREVWQMRFFTEGTLPDALIGTPKEWTPDQVRAFQDWFDSSQLTETGARRTARFVPGDVAKTYVPTKESELFGAAEEWLARVICFAFSISPQAFTKMTNRATAETQKELATEEGLEPLKTWMKSSLIDPIIANIFKRPDLCLTWHEETEIDQAALSAMTVEEAKTGLRTINEGRKKLGEEPLGPEFDVPMALITTGWVPVSLDAQLAHTEKTQALLPPPAPPGAGPGGNGSGSPNSGGGGKGGGPGRPGGASSAGLGSGGAASGGSGAAKAAADSPALAKARRALEPISPERTAGRRAQAAAAKALRKTLAATADDVAGQVAKMLKGVHKAAGSDDTPEEAAAGGAVASATVSAATANLTAEEIARKIDLSSLDLVVDSMDEALFDLAADTAFKALAQLGVTKTEQLVNIVNERAHAFARDRAAELVGKRWTDDGVLIDSPNAVYAITESTRSDLRDLIAKGLEDNIGTPAIADSIQEAFAFSADRADLVARTEISRANEQGKLNGWREAQDAGVVLLKSWLTAGDDDVDVDICEPNEAQGAIAIDDDFESGDDAPPGHPNCRCVLIPEVEGGDGVSEGGDDE